MTRLLYVKTGKAKITCGSCVFDAADNTAVLMPSDRYIYISFDGAVCFEAELEIESPLCTLILTPFECMLIDELSLLQSTDKRYGALLNALTQYLDLDEKSIPEYEDTLFSRAAEIMENSLTAPPSSEELVQQLGVSVSTLKRAFLRYAGTGVHEYLCFLRIAHAKELLNRGESVTDTARECGFKNQNYFSAAFKKITGVSPKDFANVKRRPVKNEASVKRDMPSYLL